MSPTMFLQEDITNLLGYECALAQKTNLEGDFSVQDIKNAFFSLP